jgi:hypothetical protein
VDILEIGSEGKENIFKPLPALSCGPIFGSVAIAIDESESEQGQVLLIGGRDDGELSSAVHLVDLATGMCTALPSLLSPQDGVFTVTTATRLKAASSVWESTGSMMTMVRQIILGWTIILRRMLSGKDRYRCWSHLSMDHRVWLDGSGGLCLARSLIVVRAVRAC